MVLGDHFSFWPTASVGANVTWISTGMRSQAIWVGGYAPVLFHPVPHFFVGFGPRLATDVTSTHTTTTPQSGSDNPLMTDYGLSLTVGGWL